MSQVNITFKKKAILTSLTLQNLDPPPIKVQPSSVQYVEYVLPYQPLLPLGGGWDLQKFCSDGLYIINFILCAPCCLRASAAFLSSSLASTGSCANNSYTQSNQVRKGIYPLPKIGKGYPILYGCLTLQHKPVHSSSP